MITRDRTEASLRTWSASGGNDDRRVSVREVRPEDSGKLRRMFARCSRETIYLRFHMAWPTIPEWMIGLLVGAEDGDHGVRSIVAVAGTEIVGHAMYVKDRSDDREAEIAVVVEDGRRSSGVGRLLLSEIAREARRADVEMLTCTTLGENYRIQQIVRRVFPHVRLSFSGGACYMRLPLVRRGGDPATVGDALGMGGSLT